MRSGRGPRRHVGSATRAVPSRFYPVFKYQAKAPASERPRLEDGTAHETVKPLGFISWAVRLVTPPGGTVLDMFAGSGPVGEACIIEGFRAVLIEQDPKSAELTRKRLAKPIQPVMFGLDAVMTAVVLAVTPAACPCPMRARTSSSRRRPTRQQRDYQDGGKSIPGQIGGEGCDPAAWTSRRCRRAAPRIVLRLKHVAGRSS